MKVYSTKEEQIDKAIKWIAEAERKTKERRKTLREIITFKQKPNFFIVCFKLPLTYKESEIRNYFEKHKSNYFIQIKKVVMEENSMEEDYLVKIYNKSN